MDYGFTKKNIQYLTQLLGYVSNTGLNLEDNFMHEQATIILLF